jgi:hypothetical protein
MNPDFFTPFVLQRIDGRQALTFSLEDALGVSESLRSLPVAYLPATPFFDPDVHLAA